MGSNPAIPTTFLPPSLIDRPGLTDKSQRRSPFGRTCVDDEPTGRQSEAEYTLEYPLTCPYCRKTIDTLAVVRLLRTRVNFTSTLPRRGRAIGCPKCQALLSAELSGLA